MTPLTPLAKKSTLGHFFGWDSLNTGEMFTSMSLPEVLVEAAITPFTSLDICAVVRTLMPSLCFDSVKHLIGNVASSQWFLAISRSHEAT